jgi:hypothetical protein
MKFENLNSNGLDVSEAVAEVLGIKDEVMTSGATDSENSDLDEIIRDLKEGTIKPTEGVRRAREILDSRQDYH